MSKQGEFEDYGFGEAGKEGSAINPIWVYSGPHWRDVLMLWQMKYGVPASREHFDEAYSSGPSDGTWTITTPLRFGGKQSRARKLQDAATDQLARILKPDGIP